MKDLIPGGKSDKIPSSRFPPKKVAEGAKVESEHTSNPQMAREITRDHLTEDMNYYGKLKKMEKKAVSLALAENKAKTLPMEAIQRHAVTAWRKLRNLAYEGRESARLKTHAYKLHELAGGFPLKTVTAEWDQGVMQMPERSFEPKVPNQDPWGRKKKMKTADAMFDELVKISASLSGKGGLIGAGVGAGIGTLKAISREGRERSWDDRAKLTDNEKKALRKKRLAGHASSVFNWTLGGAGVGTAHKKIGDIAGKMAGGIRAGVQPHINSFVDEVGTKVKSHVNDIGNTAKGHVVGIADAAKTHAKGVGEAAGNAAADSAAERMKHHASSLSIKGLLKKMRGK